MRQNLAQLCRLDTPPGWLQTDVACGPLFYCDERAARVARGVVYRVVRDRCDDRMVLAPLTTASGHSGEADEIRPAAGAQCRA